MSSAEMMGVPPERAQEFEKLHQEAWDLCSIGNKLPHWNKTIQVSECTCKDSCCCDCCDTCDPQYADNPIPEPEAHYSKGSAELREQFKVLEAKFKEAGFPEPIGNGHGWFHGGGVWFTGGYLL